MSKKKILSEQEYRKNLIELAEFYGCKPELLQIFAKYDGLLRGCTNPLERQMISETGISEVHHLISSRPGFLLVNGKQIGKE